MTPNKRDLKAFVRFDGTGRIVPSSLILRKRKPKVGKWVEIPAYECCNFEPIPLSYSLENFYSRIGACYSEITNLIPNINYFYDEFDGGGDEQNYIEDGGDDMWDGGNFFNTNLTQLYADAKNGNVDYGLSIPYTHTKAASENFPTPYNPTPMDGTIAPGLPFFGPDSSYFTNMYPGLFILAASGLAITEFSITGDLGSDGGAYDATLIAPTGYIGWTAFCKTNTDPEGDPSVNHIILVKGNTTGIQHAFDNTGAYDDDALLDMNVENTDIIVAVFSSVSGSPAISKNQLTNIANKILEVAGNTECTTTTTTTIL